MKVKTQDLIGPALDWAVAKCEGKNITIMRNSDGSLFPQPVWADGLWQQNYSTFWAQGGPIIEREAICIETLKEGDGWCSTKGCTTHDFLMWDQPYGSDASYGEGPTPLIAAMRCYVASKFGDEVNIPVEFLKEIECQGV